MHKIKEKKTQGVNTELELYPSKYKYKILTKINLENILQI